MMVETDIEMINQLLESPVDEETLKTLHMELDGKYQACVKNWGTSMYGWTKEGFQYNYLESSSLIDNLRSMKAKLTSYKFKVNAVSDTVPDRSVSVKINNNIGINITFNLARTDIENNTSLTAGETIEAMKRIDEIESIVKSNDSRKNKWHKAKPVLLWLADKSVDVAAVVLPLLLKIQ